MTSLILISFSILTYFVSFWFIKVFLVLICRVNKKIALGNNKEYNYTLIDPNGNINRYGFDCGHINSNGVYIKPKQKTEGYDQYVYYIEDEITKFQLLCFFSFIPVVQQVFTLTLFIYLIIRCLNSLETLNLTLLNGEKTTIKFNIKGLKKKLLSFKKSYIFKP